MKLNVALPITIGLATRAVAVNAIGVDEQSAMLLPSLARWLQSESSQSSMSDHDAGDDGDDDSCQAPTDLDEFPQWREEVGYWVGDLSFYGPNGAPNVSPSWNYRYDNYKGFITGNISGSSYRQRNVFLYPPQTDDACLTNNSTVGNGTCGTNGNSKLFEADQTGNSCDGTIEGPFAGVFDTKTTLVGNDNAVLYQVYYEGTLFQNQVTTLSGDGRRTRSAHQFDPFSPTPGVPTSCSFYRERRVNSTEFYDMLETTLGEYGVLDEDICTRDSGGMLVDGVVGGMDACRAYLEESFNMNDIEEVSTGDDIVVNGTADQQTNSSVPSPPVDKDISGDELSTGDDIVGNGTADEQTNSSGLSPPIDKDISGDELEAETPSSAIMGHRLPNAPTILLIGSLFSIFIDLISW